MKRMATLILMTFLLGFLGFWLLGVLFTNALIFHPPPAGYELEAPYRSAEMSDGTRIVYRIWENPAADRVLFYSHGNAEDLGNLDGVLPFYRDLGYTVVGYDYPGYGQSTGTPTVAGATEALETVVQTFSRERNLRPDQIILFGKSIGGGPTVAVAARRPVGGIILESTFSSIFQVPFPYARLPLDSFKNAQLLNDVDCPVLIIHGTEDRVIEPRHADTLYNAAQNPKKRMWIQGAGHNDLLFHIGRDYEEALGTFPASVNP